MNNNWDGEINKRVAAGYETITKTLKILNYIFALEMFVTGLINF